MPTIFWQEANLQISIDLPNFLTYDCGICNEIGTTMRLMDIRANIIFVWEYKYITYKQLMREKLYRVEKL